MDINIFEIILVFLVNEVSFYFYTLTDTLISNSNRIRANFDVDIIRFRFLDK